MFETNQENQNLLKDKKFMSLKNCEKRIKYVITKVKPLSQFIEEVQKKIDFYEFKHRKSLNKCISFRFEGQYYLKRDQFASAKDCFTNAILTAPFPENCPDEYKHELALTYAYRSLTFFQMKRFESALFDANQSLYLSESVEVINHKINCLLFANGFKRMNEYIDECIQRINNKENKATESLTKDNLKSLKTMKVETSMNSQQNTNEEITEETKKLPDLLFDPNVEIQISSDKGRHLVAKHNISEDTLIIREQPSNIAYFGQNIYEFCSFCHKHIGDEIWPCRHCDELVFCNDICGRRAMDGIHRYECAKTGLIFELGSNALQVFRIFAEMGPDFNPKNKEFHFVEYISKKSEQNGSEKTYNDKFDQFEFISNLMEHTIKETESEWICNTFNTIETTIFLHLSQLLDPKLIYDINSFVTFATLVYKHLNRISTNAFGWFVDKEDNNSDTHVANCLCLVSAMINHSCDPNLNWYFQNTYICFKTIRDIKEGEELYISYGSDQSSPLIERQINLKENYNFICKCNACLKSISSVPSLRCLQCDGPVIYRVGVHLNSCLLCGHYYRHIKEVIEKVNILFNELKKHTEDMAKCIEREKALESTQKVIDSLKELVHKSSCDLLKAIRQLIELCLHLGEIQRALDLSKLLLPSIATQANNLDNIFAVVLDHLFLLTRVYYKSLFANQIEDRTEWRSAFYVFNITIDLLERVKQRKQINQKKDSNSSLNNCIKQFKKQLQDLRQKEKLVFNDNISQTNWSLLSSDTEELENCSELDDNTSNDSILFKESCDSISDSLNLNKSVEKSVLSDLDEREESLNSSQYSVLSSLSSDS